MEYPTRRPFFALRFGRVLTKTCAAQTIGPDATWLLMVIVMTEDASHYRRAVTFYSTTLMDICGFNSEQGLRRARDRAIEEGWLAYEPGARRRPGKYFVCIPEHADDLDDSATDEGDGQDDQAVAVDSGAIGAAFAPDSRRIRAIGGANAARMRRECGANPAPFIPVPIPVPNEQVVAATEKKSGPRKPRETADQVALPAALAASSEFREAWERWISVRREKSRPVSATAAREQLAKISRCGAEAGVKAIEQSIANDYVGLFPEKFNNAKARKRDWPSGATHGEGSDAPAGDF